MAALLGSVHMRAVLSLEPIVMLLSALARDLQADFLPYIPRILSSYSDLVDNGASPFPIIDHTDNDHEMVTYLACFPYKRYQ